MTDKPAILPRHLEAAKKYLADNISTAGCRFGFAKAERHLARILADTEAACNPRTPGTVEVCEQCDQTVIDGAGQEDGIKRCFPDECPVRSRQSVSEKQE